CSRKNSMASARRSTVVSNCKRAWPSCTRISRMSAGPWMSTATGCTHGASMCGSSSGSVMRDRGKGCAPRRHSRARPAHQPWWASTCTCVRQHAHEEYRMAQTPELPYWHPITLNGHSFQILNLDHPEISARILGDLDAGVAVTYDHRWDVTARF